MIALGGGLLLAYRPVDKYFEIAKNLSIFAAVYRDLDAYYVDSITPAKLMGTAIDAMTESLDPYTTYYSENDLSDLKFITTGKYAGVGASIRKTGEWTAITDIYAHSPFQQAGIKIGDVIVSLNGQSAKNMSTEDISKLLKGDPGSVLNLIIRNPVNGRESAKKVTRAEISVNSVSYAGMVPGTRDGIGYIKMAQFTEFSADEVRAAFDSLQHAHPGMKAIILDLRGNPGGLLDEAVRTANIFMDPGLSIVSTRGKITGWNRDYKTVSTADNDSIPLAVLTDRLSASAAEIVAGAVQDLDRGVIIGQRSFGKGLVQTTRSLPYDTKLKLTTAKYYTPSGRCIQAIDYSHRNEDGSVAAIPDSLRQLFKTRKGRTVRDGGGIEPDVPVKPDYLSPVAMVLLNRNYIFDFASRYYYDHPDPPSPENFHLSDAEFDRFMQYLAGKDYDYQTRSEQALEDFRKVAVQEKYYEGVKNEFSALEKKMNEDKENDLIRHKEEIRQLLEEEIVGRYYLQSGRIASTLWNDEDIKRAGQVLTNRREYDSLLEKVVSSQ